MVAPRRRPRGGRIGRRRRRRLGRSVGRPHRRGSPGTVSIGSSLVVGCSTMAIARGYDERRRRCGHRRRWCTRSRRRRGPSVGGRCRRRRGRGRVQVAADLVRSDLIATTCGGCESGAWSPRGPVARPGAVVAGDDDLADLDRLAVGERWTITSTRSSSSCSLSMSVSRPRSRTDPTGRSPRRRRRSRPSDGGRRPVHGHVRRSIGAAVEEERRRRPIWIMPDGRWPAATPTRRTSSRDGVGGTGAPRTSQSGIGSKYRPPFRASIGP